MNLALMRSQNIAEHVFRFVLDRDNALPYNDQCGLNAILDGNWYSLIPTCNLFGACWYKETASKSYYTSDQCLEAFNKPHIVHFTGAKKPWHFVYHNSRFKSRYWYYRNMTPFASRISDDFGFKSILEFLLKLISKIKRKYYSRGVALALSTLINFPWLDS